MERSGVQALDIEDCQARITRMTELLGPILIAFMAVLIGFFALAVFLPMWEMNTAMQV